MKRNVFVAGALLALTAGTTVGQRRGTPQKTITQEATKSSPTPTPSVSNSSANSGPVSKSKTAESMIEMKIHTSRSVVIAGSGFGIVADIQNKSDQSIYFRPKYFTMTLPAEIDPDPPTVWWALIPPQYSEATNFEQIIHLAPSAKTTAFWASGDQPVKESWVKTWFWKYYNLISFPPGEYTIKIVGSYWPDYASADQQLSNYNTDTAEIKVVVAAPQWVIIIGAVIGGLIAYFLLPNARLHPQRLDWSGLGTAVLLSSIVTILIARLSETQFLIRVTINDFWGAITIGFIAGASGTAILQKYFPPHEGQTKTPLMKAKKWMRQRKTKRRRLAQLKKAK